MAKKRLKVGSKLVEYGKVYRVFKVEKKRENGGVEKIIHFRPYFKTSIDSSLVCSIPEKSIDITNIRRPVSKDMVDEVLEFLSKRVRKKRELDTAKAKEELKLNDIQQSARVLRRYWKAKKRMGETLTKTQRDVIDMAISKILEEVAVVNGVSLVKAEEKIKTALES